MGNRIGEACWYRRYDRRAQELLPWQAGKLLAWSVEHEQYEQGIGHMPVGIVEDGKTMQCYTVLVDRICFAGIPPLD